MNRLDAAGWGAAGSMSNIPNSWWAPLIPHCPVGSHLIEYGCGVGNTAFNLAQTSLRYSFSLVDFNKELLKQAWLRIRQLPHIKADYWDFDVLGAPPSDFPTGDISYSMGLLEHFKDEEIIEILKFQSQKARLSVISAVPNANCVSYCEWKKAKEDAGTWEYGYEDPKTEEQLRHYYKAAGIDVTHVSTIGDSFIDYGTEERYLLLVVGTPRS